MSDRAPFYFPGAPFFLVFLLQATIGGVLYYVTTAHLSQVEVHAYARSPSHEQGDHAIELRERIMPEEEAEEEQDRTVIGKDAVPRPSPSSAHSQYLDPPSQTRNSPPSTSRGGASSISPNQPRQRDLEDAASPRLTNQPVRNVERATAQGKARADSYGELRDEELVE